MKKSTSLGLVFAGLLTLQGCDSRDMLLEKNKDTSPLIPAPPNDSDDDRPRPPADEPVLTTNAHAILDLANKPVLARGINLQFANDPKARISSFAPIAEAGSNIVRIQVREDTTENELQAALDKAKEDGMIALVSFWEEEGKVYCSDNEEYLLNAVEELWLDKWLPVLAQRDLQSNLMINIASGWGPKSIFDSSSLSYGEYIDTYKYIIRRFRDIGFKVPLVIDAPGCGQDYNAFQGGRARELKANDPENNIVLSVHGFGGHWNSSEKLRYNTAALYKTQVPFIISEFGGSGFGGESAIDHVGLMAMAAGDKAMRFDIPWSQDDDKAAFVMDLPSPLNLAGATISFDIFVDSDYVSDGKLGVQLYVKDTEYRYASLGLVPVLNLRRDNWKQVQYTIESIDDITGYQTEGFDINSVGQFGIELIANGKPMDVGGAIQVDNLKISVGGVPEPLYEASFDAGLDNWAHDSGADPQLVASSGYLQMTPLWSPASNNTLIQVNGSHFNIDFNQTLTFKLRMMLPAEYSNESGLYFKIFAKHGAEWTWAPSPDKYAGDFTPGQWNDIVFTVPDMLAGASTANVLGLQLGGVTTAIDSPVLIDSFTVFPEQEVLPSEAMLTANFDLDNDSWELKAEEGSETAAATFVRSDAGTMVLTPDWSTGTKATVERLGIKAVNELDLAKLSTIKARVFVDSAYAGSDAYLKFYFQDGDKWTWFDSGLGFSVADLTLGDWTELELPVAFAEGSGFDVSLQPNAFGFQITGSLSGISGAIQLDDIQLLSAGQAAEETVVDLAFEDAADIEAFYFDFAGGSLSVGALADAKHHAFGIDPFGWIAFSWKGNEGEAAVLDMSTAEGALELNERGATIINGANGIGASSIRAQLTKP